ncbi:MAG: YkgJ family cysteine cluster protein [Gemmataceae bacterium]
MAIESHPERPNEPWFANGLSFACTQCGNCCTGAPGYVWVDDEEVAKLAAARGVPVREFNDMFVRSARGKRTLREKPNGDCVFYEKDKGCTVYSVRPKQCRTWPFWESNVATQEDWEQAAVNCPGMNQGTLIPVEEIVRRVRVIKV